MNCELKFLGSYFLARTHISGTILSLGLLSPGLLCACHPHEPTKRQEDHRGVAAQVATEPATTDKVGDLLALAASVKGELVAVDDTGERTFKLGELLSKLAAQKVTTFDPYYQKTKHFAAVPLAELIRVFWPERAGEMKSGGYGFQFEASDGYRVRLTSEQVYDSAAFLAFADLDHRSFEPIGPGHADPGPLYFIWAGDAFTDLRTHPRPWSLVKIQRVPLGDGLELTIPGGGFKGSVLAQQGYTIFSRDCIRCHSMNQQGGKMGPDLNVPQNILEYRPLFQVRAYIKNPQTFRYSTMPSHLELTETEIDAILEYFRMMKSSKVDPKKLANHE